MLIVAGAPCWSARWRPHRRRKARTSAGRCTSLGWIQIIQSMYYYEVSPKYQWKTDRDHLRWILKIELKCDIVQRSWSTRKTEKLCAVVTRARRVSRASSQPTGDSAKVHGCDPRRSAHHCTTCCLKSRGSKQLSTWARHLRLRP